MSNKSIVLSVALISVLLSACSSNTNRREIDGNTEYLDTPPLKALVVPAGITLPPQNDQFAVAVAQNQQAPVGKDLDISVPQLPLAVVNGSSVAYRNGVAIMALPNANGNFEKIKNSLSLHHIGIASEQQQSLVTKPYTMAQTEDDPAYSATYQILLQPNGSGQNLAVRLMSLTDADGNAITNSTTIQRYTIDFFNMLSSDLAASAKAE